MRWNHDNQNRVCLHTKKKCVHKFRSHNVPIELVTVYTRLRLIVFISSSSDLIQFHTVYDFLSIQSECIITFNSFLFNKHVFLMIYSLGISNQFFVVVWRRFFHVWLQLKSACYSISTQRNAHNYVNLKKKTKSN